MKQGPNVQKLITKKLAYDTYPRGNTIEDVVKAVQFLGDSAAFTKAALKAQEWVAASLVAVRAASEPNPWKAASDEEIAAEILRTIEEKIKR
jgi:hypothetical protein